MSKPLFVYVFLLLSGLPAFGQNSRLFATCVDGDAAAALRIEACTNLADEQLTPQQQFEIWQNLGDAQSDDGNKLAAKTAYQSALALQPQNWTVVERLATVLFGLGEYRAALELTSQLIDIEPEKAWHRYYQGKILIELREFDQALNSLNEAVDLDPEYSWPYYQIGRVYSEFDDFRQAGENFARAARLAPLSFRFQNHAFNAFVKAGMDDEAAEHARTLYSIDPNALTLRDWLKNYSGAPQNPVLSPLEWASPPLDQNLQYMRVLAPIDDRTEMEKSVEDLINWFGGQSYPKPISAIAYDAQYTRIDGDNIEETAKIYDWFGNEGVSVAPASMLFRGLFPVEYYPLGPNSPAYTPIFIRQSPTEIWPLEVGKTITVRGRYMIICPTPSSMSAFFMGCKKDVDRVDAGPVSWTITVEKTETIHVPYGILDTYVLRFTQNAAITILGKTQPIPIDARFWVSPDLNIWVQRQIVQDDRFLLSQLLKMTPID